jgi:8-hydroxy-5-deazaflavin:NADPH oxidoreductase
MTMKIGLLGGGHVGGALGTAWSRHGHKVYFGVRNPHAADMQETLTACGNGARAGAPADAVAFGDVVVNALPWSAVEPTLAALDLRAKILIDCSNPPSGVAGAEVVTRTCPKAKVAKCFNITGANNMANPRYAQGPAAMFACSDDVGAKAAALQLAADAGFDPFDLGPLSNAGLLESFAILWIWLASRDGMGREFAFRVARR